MRNLLLATVFCAGAALAPAQAALLIPLDVSNDLNASGPGPYGSVSVNLINPTTASFTFSAAAGFSFGDMGANINAANFSSSAVTFTALGTDSQTPSYTTLINGSGGQAQLDGFGNFTLVQNDQPNGFSSSVILASFTITDLSGTWADVNSVLTPNSLNHEVASHAFSISSNGNSFFDTNGGPGTCTGPNCNPNPPPPPPPPGDVPEPMSIAILGVGLVALWGYRRVSGNFTRGGSADC